MTGTKVCMPQVYQIDIFRGLILHGTRRNLWRRDRFSLNVAQVTSSSTPVTAIRMCRRWCTLNPAMATVAHPIPPEIRSHEDGRNVEVRFTLLLFQF